MGSRKTKEDFIKEAKILYSDYYNYSLVEYYNNNTKVKIICPLHGVFEQIPRSHLSGRGCSKCGRDKTAEILKKTNSNFIYQANIVHKNKYDYSKVKYVRHQDNVEIICKIHGSFFQTPNVHLKGSGCPVCAKIKRSDYLRKKTSDFIEQAICVHGKRYDYSKTQYVNSETKVEIICKKHGSFFQLPMSHIYGKGCFNCANSKGEDLVKAYLDKKNVVYEQQKVFMDCKDKGWLRYDFFIPSKNLLIEYNCKQHYEAVSFWGGEKHLEDVIKRDCIKKDYAEKNGLQLCIIKYTENVESKLSEVI